MRRALWLFGLAAASACSSASDDARPEASPARAVEDRALEFGAAAPLVAPHAAAPHGGSIVLVTATEAGDAVASIDDLGAGRLWLHVRDDTSAPPIPFRAVGSVVEIALAPTHDFAGDGYALVLRDGAGDLELVQLSATGEELSRLQLPDGGRYEQIAIVGESILARRSDHAIARFDLRGVARGVLAAPAGEQISALTARTGLAVALTGDPAHGMRTLRELDSSGPELRWGATTLLPRATAGRIALSPSHRRVAVLEEAGTVAILDRTTTPPAILGEVTDSTTIPPVLGFPDDDHLGIVRASAEWWTSPAALRADPWQFGTSGIAGIDPPAAVGVTAGELVIGQAGALVLARPHAAHWLGYRVIADARVAADGAGHFVIGPVDGKLLWLDHDLAVARAWDLPLGPMVTAIALDATHALVERTDAGTTHVELYDVTRPDHPVHVADCVEGARIIVDVARATVLIVDASRGERYQLDLAQPSATMLKPLVLRGGGVRMFAVDPARSDGVVAVETGTSGNNTPMLIAYKDVGSPYIPGRDLGAHDAVFVLADGTSVGTSVDGIDGLELVRGSAVERVAVPDHVPASSLNAISHDGQTLLLFFDHQTIAIDRRGAVRWRALTWEPGAVAFAADDREVAIATAAGIATYDVATGARRATGCGWLFGSWDKPPAAIVMHAEPVCAE